MDQEGLTTDVKNQPKVRRKKLKVKPRALQPERRFLKGSYVFAKVRGHPHWPAKVLEVLPCEKRGSDSVEYSLYFYGTRETATLPSTQLFTYSYENIRHYGFPKKLHVFNRALFEIEKEQEEIRQILSWDFLLKEALIIDRLNLDAARLVLDHIRHTISSYSAPSIFEVPQFLQTLDKVSKLVNSEDIRSSAKDCLSSVECLLQISCGSTDKVGDNSDNSWLAALLDPELNRETSSAKSSVAEEASVDPSDLQQWTHNSEQPNLNLCTFEAAARKSQSPGTVQVQTSSKEPPATSALCDLPNKCGNVAVKQEAHCCEVLDSATDSSAAQSSPVDISASFSEQ